MIPAPVWTHEQLEDGVERAAEHFRQSRYTEPVEAYHNLFDEYQGIVEEVIEQTVDLTELDLNALDLLTDERKREVFRYLSGPPISEDDLRTLINADSISPHALQNDPELVKRMLTFIHDWHDRRRFPWFSEDWEPEEHHRNAAILATAALLTASRLATLRRNDAKKQQEWTVANRLKRSQFTQVPARRIATLGQAPGQGEFCPESLFGERKADFVVRLFDGRVMPLECKVSNSATNSVKRINNDAAVKAESWRQDFGQTQVVPAAVLSGVYKVHNLENAQNRGLTLFWAHDLDVMVNWIHNTYP